MPKKNRPQPGVQVQRRDRHVDHAFAGMRELRHYPVQRALALGVAELAFHPDAGDLVVSLLPPTGLQLGRVGLGFLGRTP